MGDRKANDVPIRITGPGIVSVRPEDIIKSARAQRQIDALRRLVLSGIVRSNA